MSHRPRKKKALPTPAKGQNAENPLGEAQVPSEFRNAALAAYLRQQADSFVGREHPARNALFAMAVVASCCDSGKDLKSLAEALRIAQACLRRFGV
jgi:hypothetical protein